MIIKDKFFSILAIKIRFTNSVIKLHLLPVQMRKTVQWAQPSRIVMGFWFSLLFFSSSFFLF